MEFTTITYRRPARFKVNGAEALALRQQGHSLPEIKQALGTEANLSTISRAIKRAEEQHES
jgi:transcriptional regulator